MRTARIFRLGMAHPGDLSELDALIAAGTIRASEIVAIIGKTEGNGGVNDFTRGFFTQTVMMRLSEQLQRPADELVHEIPCVLSGGTEGVMSPHYSLFCVSESEAPQPQTAALAIGTAFSAAMPVHEIGRRAHVESVAATVRQAIAAAGITRTEDVHVVQVKCPCVTAARAAAAIAAGQPPVTTDPNRSMALARAAGAFGVALALGEIGADDFTDASLLSEFSLQSPRASISSGVEVESNEVVVLGNSVSWTGPLRIASRPMADALDIGAITAVLADLGLAAAPQLAKTDADRVATVLVKCEPDRRGLIRGHRHTMLDDTDINAQRHIRGAVAGLVAGVIGDGRIFVSGGAEHQGPDGGGLIAVIAAPAGAQS
ncbi:ring-opening amidohydrolase [Bradyrhizobium sp. HKCCYLS2038]|uniref:cyanuric acid amidohydrolase n=1 Tax=unclassified Bradyrhizobium TaxID=2631580 RepID=UPI003EBB786E